MTSHSPNGLASHNAPGSTEEDDKVVFKSLSDTSRSGSGFAQQASINGKDAAAEGEWNGTANGARNQGELDPTWDLASQVRSMKLADGGKADGDTAAKASTNGVLAPAAEIQEGQPHSRHSSGASSFDSPAIPTPGGKHHSAAEKSMKSPYPTSPTSGYGGYGYDAQDSFNGITNVLQSNGLTNGIGSPPMHYPQAGIHPSLSPLVNGGGQSGHMGPMPPFSPPLPAHMGHTPMSPQSQQMYQGGDFGDNFGMQQRMNARGGGGRGQHNVNGNGATSFAAFNGQQANGTASGFAYGSPPPQGFNPGLMSPTMTSPTFLPSQGIPYSPTPYSPYAAGQPLGGTAQMFDMMSNPAMSPQSQLGMLPGRNQNQLRGHGYSASNPPNLRDATATAQSPTRTVQLRAQPPRGAAPNTLNHAHSLSLPQTPFSPQLGPVGYGPMSPPPYPTFYPGMAPPQGLTPEILQAMAAGMAQAGQTPQGGQVAFNPAIQSALGTLQQDPSVMALIQQGGGPSANNRKLGLYKTELCRSWEEKGSCKYGEKCQFAHGEAEQRRVERHPKYKTEICRTFWVSGSCPYGKRCCFIHTELPANAAAGATNGQAGENQRSGTTPNQNERPQVDGRARSMSTNSDPNNEPPSSLLARISARAQANNPANQTPIRPNRSGDGSPTNQGVTDKVIAEAVARALTTYGLPASSQSSRIEPPAEPVAAPSQTTSAFSGFSTRNTSTPASGVGHHRVSASVDFGRQGRSLGSDLSLGLGSGMGHQRNPSASSVVPPFGSLSRTPLSGQSSPFGGEGSSSRGVTAGSALLESHPW
ncbi:hypothetical protein FRC04_000503 [Tulasnella sp. 424]|nr:hypothetical protein FRC04_000503 [Tulasnella sp. 424]KAG8973860.1 hypothetical protein FRC05_008080 [Tulasnella sp. 425]